MTTRRRSLSSFLIPLAAVLALVAGIVLVWRYQAIATRVLKGTADSSQRLQWLYDTIFNRPPTTQDAAHAKAHLASVQNTLKQSEHRAWSGLIRGMISSNEFMSLDR